MRTLSAQMPIPQCATKADVKGYPPAKEEHLLTQRAVVPPIQSLGFNHREAITSHLQALDRSDRYLRFGYAATNAQIDAYVNGLDLQRDEVFGIYNRKLALIAMAHLALPAEHTPLACAEFGVSVLKPARGRGYGARLFERAAAHTRNAGFSRMMIHALSENTSMLNIVRSAGAVISRDGSDSEAFLKLGPATLDSRITEIIEQQWAQVDYRYKQHGKNLRAFLSSLQTHRVSLVKPATIDET